jgi:hypothetical protein
MLDNSENFKLQLQNGTNKRRQCYEYHHNERWNADLLKGLGREASDNLPNGLSPRHKRHKNSAKILCLLWLFSRAGPLEPEWKHDEFYGVGHKVYVTVRLSSVD